MFWQPVGISFEKQMKTTCFFSKVVVGAQKNTVCRWFPQPILIFSSENKTIIASVFSGVFFTVPFSGPRGVFMPTLRES